MIIRSSHPLSPSVEVVIDSRSVDYTSISNFDIELTENEHDMATIVMQGIPPEAVTDYIGAAVSLTINSGVGRAHTFFGYIVATEPFIDSKRGLINNSPIHTTKVRCIGASYVMKETASKVWDYPTIGNVVTTLSRKHNFSVSYPKDSFKPTRLTQSNESDWSFLRRVVATYGYCVAAHGTHINVWDPDKAYSRLPSFHVLTTQKATMDETPCAVLKFNADMGHHSSFGDVSRSSITSLNNRGTITKIDAADGDMKRNRSVIASLFDNPIKHPYRTFEEAQRAVDASQRFRTVYNATAEVTAGAGILPGGIVVLAEYGGDFDGVWYVSSVCHRMGNSLYTTELKLHRHNKQGEEPTSKRTELSVEPPKPQLVRNQWVASVKKVNEYV